MTSQKYRRADSSPLISQPPIHPARSNFSVCQELSKTKVKCAKSLLTWSNLISKDLPVYKDFNFTTRHHKNQKRIQYSIFSNERKQKRNVYSSSVIQTSRNRSDLFSVKKRRNSCIKLNNKQITAKKERGKIFVESKTRLIPIHTRKFSYQGQYSSAFNTPKLKKLNSKLNRPERVL